MSIDSRQQINQSGVIPWRVVGGRIWVLLITSSHSGKWGIPKGHLEPFLPAHESAAIEAYEEAGVTGSTDSLPLGTYTYRKRSHEHQVDVYTMEVTEELTQWPEKGKRLRKWVPQEKAASRVANPGLAQLILMLPPPPTESGTNG
ncbi:NUDIX domain-containing protein [bacterium]|nr:NUDIX domain-containing protein [bacterium]